MSGKKLTPIRTYKAGGKTVIRYKCECGKEFSFRSYDALPEMDCNTCRYSRSSDWKENKKLYLIWNAMHQRCENENTYGYKWYGAAGISVCVEWKTFHPFLEWAISHGYQDGLSIERIDINGDYCPDNCIWIPKSKQAQNTRLTYNNKTIKAFGETKTYEEWAKISNITPRTIAKRLRKGWSPEDAVSIRKSSSSERLITIGSKTKRFSDWCKEYGISPQAVYLRIKSGMPLIDAITKPKTR